MTNEHKKRGKVFFLNIKNYYLPSIAIELNYDIKVENFTSEGKFLEDIKQYSPDFIVANIEFKKFKTFFQALAIIKQIAPNITIIVTGEPFLTYNTNVTYENPFIDYVIIGEPEYTLRDILDGMPNNEILGICYNNENMQAVKNEQRPCIENLDNLPIYIKPITNSKDTVTIEVSRGCPYHCFFCLASIKNGIALRSRTPNNIINEIKEYKEKYNCTKFYFKSDIFNFDNSWVQDLCNKIIENDLKISWTCDIVPKNLDANLVKLMKKSGCTICRLGIESGSKEILEKLEKEITVKSIEETVTLFRQNKIKVISCFLFGLPWDTEETIMESIKFAKKLRSDSTFFNIAAPLPGTNFFVYSMLNKLMASPQELLQREEKLPLARTHKLSRERILELKEYADKQLSKKDLISRIKLIFNI